MKGCAGMKKKHVSALKMVLTYVMCFALALSCLIITDNRAKSKLKLPVKALKMYVGDSYRLKLKKCKFNTSKKKVAEVNRKGKIKAKKAGKAKITVRKNNSRKKAVINIKVGKHATGVKIDGALSIFLKMGQTWKIQATVMPAKVLYKDVEYIVADANIASVSADGQVVPKNPGTTSVSVVSKATSSKNKKVSAVVNVIVAPSEDNPGKQDLGENLKDDFTIVVETSAPVHSEKPTTPPKATIEPVVTHEPESTASVAPTSAPVPTAAPTPGKLPESIQDYIASIVPDDTEPLAGSVVVANSAGQQRTVYFLNKNYTGNVSVSIDGYSYSRSGNVSDFLDRLENETGAANNSTDTVRVMRRKKSDSWTVTLGNGAVYYVSGKVQDTIYNSPYGIMIVEGNTLKSIVVKGN